MQHVLIAEDDPDIAALIRHYLEKAGYHAEVVESGVVAVHDVPRARHGGCDILDREQRRALPVGGFGFVFGHGAQRVRFGARREACRGSTVPTTPGSARGTGRVPKQGARTPRPYSSSKGG